MDNWLWAIALLFLFVLSSVGSAWALKWAYRRGWRDAANAPRVDDTVQLPRWQWELEPVLAEAERILAHGPDDGQETPA